jgi:hypothetical protein
MRVFSNVFEYLAVDTVGPTYTGNQCVHINMGTEIELLYAIKVNYLVYAGPFSIIVDETHSNRHAVFDAVANRWYMKKADRNRGTATIASGSTSVTVPHGLDDVPSVAVVTPRGNLGAVWVSARDATSITINCATAPSADTLVDWYVEK